MGKHRTTNRRALLVALGGTVLLATLGGAGRAEDPMPGKYGLTVDQSEPKKAAMGLKDKPKEPVKTEAIEVLKYDLLGGPIIVHGQVWVDTRDNNNTVTFGEVDKGPPPFHGLFKGYYFLTKANPDAFFYDDPLRPREALQLRLDLETQGGYVVYRTGHKRILLPGWVWDRWHVLKAW